MFGIFLFLIYYLQQTLGYSPVVSGVAFLPLRTPNKMIFGVVCSC
jgi:hypothetical protein